MISYKNLSSGLLLRDQRCNNIGLSFLPRDNGLATLYMRQAPLELAQPSPAQLISFITFTFLGTKQSESVNASITIE